MEVKRGSLEGMWEGLDDLESTRVASDKRVLEWLWCRAISGAGVQSSSAFEHSKEEISSRSNEYVAGERTRGAAECRPLESIRAQRQPLAVYSSTIL